MKRSVNPLQHKIKFETNADNFLHITINTKRLIIQSITNNNEADCIKLVSDKEVMKTLATGVIWTEAETKARLALWTSRWQNHDPFSVYAITEADSNIFVGIIAIGQPAAGQSELSFVLHRKFWGKGYGTQATDAILQSLIPRLIARDYRIKGRTLKEVVATALTNNIASNKILIGAGFYKINTVHKYDALRFAYNTPASNLVKQYCYFFKRKEQTAYESKEYWHMVDDGAELSSLEMAASSFGQSCQK